MLARLLRASVIRRLLEPPLADDRHVGIAESSVLELHRNGGCRLEIVGPAGDRTDGDRAVVPLGQRKRRSERAQCSLAAVDHGDKSLSRSM